MTTKCLTGKRLNLIFEKLNYVCKLQAFVSKSCRITGRRVAATVYHYVIVLYRTCILCALETRRVLLYYSSFSPAEGVSFELNASRSTLGGLCDKTACLKMLCLNIIEFVINSSYCIHYIKSSVGIICNGVYGL